MLNCHGDQRLLCLAIDETIWRPGWEAIADFRPEVERYSILGGGLNSENNSSILSPSDERKDSLLSKLSLSIVVSRRDTNHFTVDMNLIPLYQGPGQQKADFFLSLLGQALHSFASTGSKVPPGFDGGSSNSLANLALLGLLDTEELDGIQFFERCKKRALTEIKLFPFRVLKYGQWWMGGCLDCHHVLKNYTLQHISGTRTIFHGASCGCICPVFFPVSSGF